MKNKKYNKPVSKVSDYEFSIHSEDQLKVRFKLSSSDVTKSLSYFKKGSMSCRWNQVRNKIMSYSHEDVFYNERMNMMLVCDTITKKICTVMYLDPNKI